MGWQKTWRTNEGWTIDAMSRSSFDIPIVRESALDGLSIIGTEADMPALYFEAEEDIRVVILRSSPTQRMEIRLFGLGPQCCH